MHDQELKDQARDSYIIDGMTLDQVARETEIPIRTVEEWSIQEGWVSRRREYRLKLQDIKKNTVELRQALIAKAVSSLDPQDVYAAVRLEALSARGEKKQEGIVEIDRPKLFLEVLEWIACWLKERDPEGLKVLAANFDGMTEEYKAGCLKHGNA